ncbi:S-layer glycoprotein N-glycosyltransferase AglJ [Halorarius litoreus]|uniref:S-layer glycoprotein N-glycosyltransferase AglJ n=1 Tax=Halorarius litoreus TaxID=2962676 RepID=UPI0020CD0D44|nr:S-layer glycoprotein N-glycosyltransferase AglJ [Halorarius litoreus]
MDRSDVCVLLPTLNEAETIGSVVTGFREEGFDHVLVIDGGSDDGTQSRARDAGARVLEQSGEGKGQAVREGVRAVEQPVVLMADGDGTYRPEDAERMLEPIFAGRAEHVIGDRFADMEAGAMTRLNRAGNGLTNFAFELIHGKEFQDILSGYRAFTRESFERHNLAADGFGIETELAVECVKQGVRVEVVPISYLTRPDDSETNLHPVKDGGRIFLTLYRLAKTNNPLFYFGSVGTAAILTGLGVAGYVLYEFYIKTPRVSHEVLALVAASGIIFGVQLLMFGVLSDIIVTVNREQTRRFEELAEQLNGAESRSVDERADEASVSAEANAGGFDRIED